MTTDVWPDKVQHWRCPACGRQITGAYAVDETKETCTKTKHVTTAVSRQYELVPSALKALVEEVERIVNEVPRQAPPTIEELLLELRRVVVNARRSL